MRISPYDDAAHRDEVIEIWKKVFGYSGARNDPELSIDNKISRGDGLFFIAEDSHRVTGTIMAGYDGHRGWIYSLAVVPDMRGRGTGTALLRHAEDELKKLGCVKINLQILKENEAVIRFYRKNGFEAEERISMGKEITENMQA